LKSHEEDVRRAFDCFCKKVVRNEARDYYDEIKRRRDREVPFCEIAGQEMEESFAMNEYPSDFWRFNAAGYSVAIRDDAIAKAIAALSDEKRGIVLLAYFLGMTDKEIGEQFNLIRRTVQKKRTSSLKDLKKFLEANTDE
jgi:RNA polymerase sigma factor (sigma-70 family)